jgi:hypothetical protein
MMMQHHDVTPAGGRGRGLRLPACQCQWPRASSARPVAAASGAAWCTLFKLEAGPCHGRRPALAADGRAASLAPGPPAAGTLSGNTPALAPGVRHVHCAHSGTVTG